MISESVAHIWTASLDAPCVSIAAYETVLSNEERERANRFRFPHLKQSYIVAHGVLRHLLAQYTGRSPRDLQFTHHPQGKPALIQSDLQFNLSHSGRLAVFAFARETSVGVDVEQARSIGDVASLAARSFTLSESAFIGRLPEEQQSAAFFRLWTLKEAFLKATGEGLSRPLDSFSVELDPAPSLRLEDTRERPQSWSLHSFAPAPGYFGGFVSEGVCLRLLFHTYTHRDSAESCLSSSSRSQLVLT